MMKELSRSLPIFIISALLLAAGFFFARTADVPADATIAKNGDVSALRASLLNAVKSLGPEKAYAAFKDEYLRESFGIQHNAAHLMGESLYEVEGLSGVRTCDPEFNFGCFHGFFSKAVRIEGLGVVTQLDAECKSAAGGRYLPCQHGLGHGILEFVGHTNLDEALEECARIRVDPIGGCTSGVFMEYNVPLVQGDDGTFSLHTRQLADPSKPYEPCLTLVTSFRDSCFHEIPQWWQQVLSGDVAKMGKLCAALEEDSNRQACFSGIGNHSAPSANYEVDEAIAYCDLMPTAEGEALCKRASAGAFSGNINDAEGAKAVCASIEPSSPYHCTL